MRRFLLCWEKMSLTIRSPLTTLSSQAKLQNKDTHTHTHTHTHADTHTQTHTQVIFYSHHRSHRVHNISPTLYLHWGFPGGSDSKESACNAEYPGFDSWVGKIPWKKEWQYTLVFLAWRIPWAKEPDGLQSMELQRVGHE